MTDSAERYRARFQHVMTHLDQHPDAPHSTASLSALAGYSRFHFHRQFAALFGITAHHYLRLARLKRASYRLAYRSDAIIDIALDAGYESPEAFARAFRPLAGQSPSDFRRQPDWAAWHASLQPLARARDADAAPTQSTSPREVQFPSTAVAVLEHRGDPQRLGDSLRRFIAWRRHNRLPPRISATFNVLYDDPGTTPPEEFRLDLCAATQQPVAPNEFGVVAGTLPGGRCAVLRHTGSDDRLGARLTWLYAHWLPASGEEPRDAPLLLQRLSLFPDVAEHEAELDILLPLR